MTSVGRGGSDASDWSEDGFHRPPLRPLLTVVGYKRLILLVRYPVNTASRFLSMLVFFALVFFGGRAVAGPALSESLSGVVAGFFLWTMATVGFRGLASNVMNEARWGTLERLSLSPYGFGTVLAAETLADVCLSLAWAGAMLAATMAVTGRWLHVDPLTVVPLSALVLAPVLGVGFVAAGLAVLYKRVENLFGLVTFGFVGLIAAPAGRHQALKLLPATQGSYLTRVAMTEGVRLWEFPATDLVLLVVTSLAYLLAGFYCFHRAQHRARRKGLLGQY